MAMNYAGQAQGQLNRYTGSTLATLRYYFAVNQLYVLRKLRVIALPFRHKEWDRRLGEDGAPLPPKADVNAPDLYLPLMAYVTYILAYGFTLGAEGKFTSPDVLGAAGSSGLGVLVLETAMLKFGLYLRGAAVPVLDSVALSGYKFLGAVVTLAASRLCGAYGHWSALLICTLLLGTFVVKMLRAFARPAGFTPGFLTQGVGSPTGKGRTARQDYLLWGVGALQFPWLWYLCRIPSSQP
mmetsp:Transcript_15674/g.51730  ORF Transcript_15674/g.51730 Transcript_15674/m.51730 type:complete len:239 (-) Transcript_15674:2271-2987(-)